MSRVVTVVATQRFEEALKSLKKDHKNKVLKKLDSYVTSLVNLEISTQGQNHPLTDAKGHRDIHLEGKRLILLYRYDFKGTDPEELVLVVELRLQDIVDHKELRSYDKKNYDAPVHVFDPANILSGTDVIESGKIIIC